MGRDWRSTLCQFLVGIYGHTLLAAAGAHVDGVRVCIPPGTIEDVVAASPQSFTLWGRPVGNNRMQDERYWIHVQSGVLDQAGLDRVYFGPGPTCTYFVDPDTGERRKSRRGDPGMTALVCDALDSLDYLMGLGLIDDVPVELAPVYEFAEMVANTAKPVLPWVYSVENISDIYQIALAVAGSEETLAKCPFFALFTTSLAALQHLNECLGAALWAAERGIPIVYLAGGCAGGTAPVTGAGTLVIFLASTLSGLAVIQPAPTSAPWRCW